MAQVAKRVSLKAWHFTRTEYRTLTKEYPFEVNVHVFKAKGMRASGEDDEYLVIDEQQLCHGRAPVLTKGQILDEYGVVLE